MIRRGNILDFYARRADKFITLARRDDDIIFFSMNKYLDVNTINTIRNTYGEYCLYKFARYLDGNPGLAPFVNEDPHIINSIVDTGYRRWIVTDGSSYFNTEIYPLMYPLSIKSRVYISSIPDGKEYNFFGTAANSGANGAFVFGYRSYKFCNYSSSAFYSTDTIDAETEYDVEWKLLGYSGRKIIVDGETYDSTANNNSSMGKLGLISIGIFSGGGTTLRNTVPSGSMLTHAEIFCNDNIYYYIPFKRQGEMEMLDINNLSLATRTGTFTELYTNIN